MKASFRNLRAAAVAFIITLDYMAELVPEWSEFCYTDR